MPPGLDDRAAATADTAAVAAACTRLMPAEWDRLPSERTAMARCCPAWLITPMLLITHSPRGPAGSQPFLTAGRVPVDAALVTPQFCPALTSRIRPSS